MHIVAQLNADLDDVQTHLDDMLAGGAIVPGPHVAFECILQAWQAVKCILQKNLHPSTTNRVLLSCCVHTGGMASFYEVCVILLIHFKHAHVLEASSHSF